MQFNRLGRREFITLLGGAAAWPLAARAQQRERPRRIGVLLSGLGTEREMKASVDALRDGLRALGWIDSRDYHIAYRWPGSVPERVRAAAAELVRTSPDVMVAGSLAATLSIRRQTKAVPIVFVNLADPVGAGLIPSLAKTSGNITGFTAFEYGTAGKWLEVLKEITPRAERIAFIFGGSQFGPFGENFYRALEPAAAALSVEVTPIRIRSDADVQSAIAELAAKPHDGLIAAAEAGTINNRAAIIAAAARHRIPAVYPFRFFVADGGLASYGVDLLDQYRRAASYVDRILKGEKPADLPVQAPTKYELVLNLKTAKALGLEVPATLLARANEVIE
jgi:putative ABC transport system substrate-binding protein